MGDSTPQVPAIPVDPNLAQEQADAEALLTQQARVQDKGDMADLMALYGTRLALASTGSGRSPISPAASGTRSV